MVLNEGGGIHCIAHSPQNGTFRWGLREWLHEHADASTIALTERTGYLPLPLARAWEIEKFTRCRNWRPDRADREGLAAKWIDALIDGGYAELDAVRLIGEVSAPPFSTALEIVDATEIPTDRRYRDAWRRSSNGGPIWIDEEKAQMLDERRMWALYQRAA